MAAFTGKRKREDVAANLASSKKPATHQAVNGKKRTLASSQPKANSGDAKGPGIVEQPADGTLNHQQDRDVCIQVVTGSYERVLHGFSATIPSQLVRNNTAPEETNGSVDGQPKEGDVSFSDTFLFTAHTSAVRCLALSPSTDSDKRILATGSSDERINLYHISTTPPKKATPSVSSLLGSAIAENAGNRSLGSLIHHDRAITCLQFPTKSKLFSAAEDNTIAISRTRDWTVLSSIKAPIPKPHGRPSGDTAGPGELPAGVNDFAIHPSQKLMLSVGRGERCMRLWNLMTGKKAGVLNFDRDLLAQVGEGRHSSGEGRQVLWDTAGESYIVGFERGAAIFGMESKAKAVITPSPPTKLHRMHILPKATEGPTGDTIAVSTEDGRVLLFNTTLPAEMDSDAKQLPSCACIAQVGGHAAGVRSRVKDFEILQLPRMGAGEESPLLFVTGSSDGSVRLWLVFRSELTQWLGGTAGGNTDGASKQVKEVGTLVGTLESGDRIKCLGAFIMDGKASGGGSLAEEAIEAALGIDDDEVESDVEEELSE